jgi:8-oxo-dGTP diphosphatase
MPKKCVCASSIIFRDGMVLLLWHKKLGVWLYPGGHVEENETPQETAVRETLEETGLRIKIIIPRAEEKDMLRSKEANELPRPFMILYEYVPYKTGEHEHFDMVYLGKIEGKGPKGRKTEDNELKWFSEKDIDSLKTFENVRLTLHRAFAATSRFSSGL